METTTQIDRHCAECGLLDTAHGANLAGQKYVKHKFKPVGATTHIDFVFDGMDSCKVCGLVRPAEGWTRPCKGRVELSLRDAPAPRIEADPVRQLLNIKTQLLDSAEKEVEELQTKLNTLLAASQDAYMQFEHNGEESDSDKEILDALNTAIKAARDGNDDNN